MKAQRSVERLQIALLVLYSVGAVLPLFAGRIPATLIVAANILPAALFALLHGAQFYRTRGILVFAAICLLIGNAIENLGVYSGFPFGRYYFTPGMGPKLFLVPVLMGPAYFGMGYLAWTVSRIIVLCDPSRPLTRRHALIIPLLAALAMTSWDLAVDPTLSTLGGYWVWRNGGSYFGVPVSNFAGWLVTNYLIYQCFALYLRRSSLEGSAPGYAPGSASKTSYWRLPVIFYAVVAAGNAVRAIPFPGTPGAPGSQLMSVVDATGRHWSVRDINLASALVSLVIMGSFALLAWKRLRGKAIQLTPVTALAHSLPMPVSDTACPDCGTEMDQIDKTTFTGRDMREYQCPKCGRKMILDRGKALWAILSEANEREEEQ